MGKKKFALASLFLASVFFTFSGCLSVVHLGWIYHRENGAGERRESGTNTESSGPSRSPKDKGSNSGNAQKNPPNSGAKPDDKPNRSEKIPEKNEKPGASNGTQNSPNKPNAPSGGQTDNKPQTGNSNDKKPNEKTDSKAQTGNSGNGQSNNKPQTGNSDDKKNNGNSDNKSQSGNAASGNGQANGEKSTTVNGVDVPQSAYSGNTSLIFVGKKGYYKCTSVTTEQGSGVKTWTYEIPQSEIQVCVASWSSDEYQSVSVNGISMVKNQTVYSFRDVTGNTISLDFVDAKGNRIHSLLIVRSK